MDNFRSYELNSQQEELYKHMYNNQTLNFVRDKMDANCKRQCKLSIKNALKTMNDYIDPSDPDVDLPNLVHAYQTAEAIRRKYPTDYEFQITGLIHDVGKLLFKFGEPGWAIVGDTYVLGAAVVDNMVYSKHTINIENSNYDKFGIYEEKCGIEKLTLSFGHDEYLYQVLKRNLTHKLSDKYLNIIRFHSFYPWHTYGEYKYFMNDTSDIGLLKDVQTFNAFDLYSKSDNDTITCDIIDYYDKLLDEYFPEELNWY
jgi:inositol oxygenase